MTYTRIKIIIGAPVTEELSKAMDRWEDEGDERWAELEDLGFVELYHGGYDGLLGFIGEELGEIDECATYTLFTGDPPKLTYVSRQETKEIELLPTMDQINSAKEKMAALPDHIKELIPPRPALHFVYCTS